MMKIVRRNKFRKKAKLGLPPGTPVFTGTQKMAEVDISVISYDEFNYQILAPKNVAEVLMLINNNKNQIMWVNIDGVHDVATVEELCVNIGLHKLSVEDILSIGQRPKIEEYNTYLHAVIKTLSIDSTDEIIDFEQISFILKDKLLISFQEKNGDVFDGVRDRIWHDKGTIRKKGADYLLYALLDSVVDHYFKVLEDFGDKLDDLETELLENPSKDSLSKLHVYRREALNLRRLVYPLREMIGDLEKLDETHVNPNIKVFIRDLYDHTIQVVETIDVFRDTTASLLDLYINSLSNKTNEIMKVLTIMTSIFIPLSFIAGVYGMNFQYMPELGYKYGYFVVLGVMAVVFVGILLYLKRRNWL